MTIQLPTETEALIRQKVASGLYPSAEAAIVAAVQLLDEHDRHLAALQAKLQSGIDQLERSEGLLFTPEWSADRVRVVRERAAAGETPHPDVCP